MPPIISRNFQSSSISTTSRVAASWAATKTNAVNNGGALLHLPFQRFYGLLSSLYLRRPFRPPGLPSVRPFGRPSVCLSVRLTPTKIVQNSFPTLSCNTNVHTSMFSGSFDKHHVLWLQTLPQQCLHKREKPQLGVLTA